MMTTPNGWTSERIDDLKRLWAEGLSASQVASQLGCVTRNAVIGKVYRLGLAKGATARKAPKVLEPKPAVSKTALKAEALDPGLSMAVTFEARTWQHCHWPLWGNEKKPAVYLYCGAPVSDYDHHWCGYHHDLGTDRSNRRRQQRSAVEDARAAA